MQEQTIYYKLENPYGVSKFIKKVDTKVIQVTIDNRNGEKEILYSEERCNLESMLVCPKSEFEQAFANAMLKCEGMQLFRILGLDMSPSVKALMNQGLIQNTTERKMMSTAQQFNQMY
jgi:hypothetical protein